MNTVLKNLLLVALAIAVSAMVAESLRSGVVRWRTGSVAAVRSTQPGLFWLLIALEVFALGCIVFGLF